MDSFSAASIIHRSSTVLSMTRNLCQTSIEKKKRWCQDQEFSLYREEGGKKGIDPDDDYNGGGFVLTQACFLLLNISDIHKSFKETVQKLNKQCCRHVQNLVPRRGAPCRPWFLGAVPSSQNLSSFPPKHAVSRDWNVWTVRSWSQR